MDEHKKTIMELLEEVMLLTHQLEIDAKELKESTMAFVNNPPQVAVLEDKYPDSFTSEQEQETSEGNMK